VEPGIKRAGGVVVRYDGDEGFGVIGATGNEELSRRKRNEDARTKNAITSESKPKVNGTSPLSVPTSSRISPEKLVPELDDLG
jgi:hypothetical protein